ncbi:RHS repeat-associated core domain-containing protein [Lysobacter yananisis]|uniref:RHS repeat-associated core domain-containing protein n=1 Tax=Lysobacter yananisis TaxID=1003114 RepID=A0ABY9P4J1_9GAMM|nr:RHS repeat-associated core domain-containing protein [Lysobacter yananisis]WMT01968.1 RHS repeat-associated core domain-containing protein [Lysobacter yananisis]
MLYAQRKSSRYAKSWLSKLVLVCSAAIFAPLASAQESQVAWKIIVPTGQAQFHNTYQQAADAIKALPYNEPGPNPYPYLTVVKDNLLRADGKGTIVYWMGLTEPLDPDWRYDVAVGSGTSHSSEALAVAELEAIFNEQSPACPATAKATPTGNWAAPDPQFAGMLESRAYGVEHFRGDGSSTAPCVKDQVTTQEMSRTRRMQCPIPYTNWSNQRGACVNEDFVAAISTDKILECGGHRGNPCNVKTGEKIENQTDFDLGWISLTRSYHSGIAVRSGSFGPGWTHSLDLRLSISADTLGLSGGNGYQVRFAKVGNAFVAADSSGDRIVASGSQWLLHRPDEVLVFDSQGRLVEQQAEDGTKLTYVYGAYDRLDSVTHSTGRSVKFNYAGNSGDAPISSITSADTTLASYTYTPGRQVETAAFPGGGQRKYHYEDSRFPRHLTGVTHEDNKRYSTFAYDAKGRVITSQHDGGADKITLAYRPEGGTEVTDSLGQKTTYGLTSGTGVLPRRFGDIVDENGTVKNMYNAESTDFRGRPASLTDRKGIKSEFAYAEANDAVTGALARTVTTTEAVGKPEQRVSTATTDVASNRLIRSTVGNQETRIARNARLQPISVAVRDTVANVTRTTAYAYCEAADVVAANSTCPILGLLKSVDGPRSDVNDITKFEYYGSDDSTCATTPALCTFRKGDLRKTIDAAGLVTEISGYDAQGRVLSVVDPNGVVTDSEYNTRGWLTASKVRGTDNAVETDDLVTKIEYFPTGLTKQVTLADGNFTTFAYDNAQRLTGVTDRSGATVQYTLDLAGNRKVEDTKNSAGTVQATLSRVLNVLGQVQTYKDGLSHATGYTYDAEGHPDTTTDALGRVTDQDYDPLGRLVKTLQDVGTGRINAETKIEYDALDQVTKVIDPKGLSTVYARNGFGELTQLTSPDTGVTGYTYDASGQTKTRTDARNITTTYSYDALGRLTQRAYPTAVLGTSYTYDTVASGCPAGETFSKGRLSQSVGTGGALRYCYDRFGRMVRKIVVTTGPVLTLRYAYTAAGTLKSVTYPDGSVADYVRGSHGRITQIGVTRPGASREILLTAVGYAAYGPAAGWAYGNSQPMTRNVDRNYDISRLVGSAPDGLSLHLTRNEVGNVSRFSTQNQSAILARYEYDRLDRLTQTQDGPTATPLETYGYDATGNRTSFKSGASAAQAYAFPNTSHRLQSVAGIARSYDAAGNTTSVGGTAKQYVYNDLGRLAQFKVDGAVKMNYAYNGLGQQVRRYNDTSIRHSLYAEDGSWLGEYDNAGAALQQVVWMDELPVGVIQGSGTAQKLYYVEPDHLGTPRIVVDPVRNKAVWTWNIKSEVFANTPPNEDPDLDGTKFVFDMRFPGQRFEAVSGLIYNYFRDYDPATGRYIQSDPTGLDGGISTYGYSSSTPTNAIDPDGLRVRVRSTGNGGYTARFDPVSTQAVATINQIRTLNPTFRFKSTGPRGSSVTRQELNSLNGTLYETRAAHQSLWPNSCPPNNKQTSDQLNREILRRATGEYNVDAMARAAAAPDRDGLTRAGRALDKHGSGQRSDSSPFPAVRGGPAQKNAAGQFQVEDILTHPNAIFTPLGRGGVGVRTPDGREARYDANGRFAGFIE